MNRGFEVVREDMRRTTGHQSRTIKYENGVEIHIE